MKQGFTESVCPECLKHIAAERVEKNGDVFLRKSCPEHGVFETVIWRGGDAVFDKWWDAPPETCQWGKTGQTCCALVEVTGRCDMRCAVCFASAGGGKPVKEPTLMELYNIFRRLVRAGNTFVQLSGGEPAVRSDLPDIVKAARRAGMETVQLNSNGLKLSESPEYAKILYDAGLSFVFMQFDGVSDAPYEKLRGAPLFETKKRAIENCAAANLGVTLVPTIVPGVNDGEIGAVIEFAIAHSPAVRGVHFQPVSYFGRYPEKPKDEDRITLPEIMRAIETQTGGRVKMTNLVPGSCDHRRCGFHSDFAVLPDGELTCLTPKYNPDKACCGDEHIKNRRFVSRRWTRPGKTRPETKNDDFQDMDTFLDRVKSHGFTITGMAFQDAWTVELERLAKCSLHVASGTGGVTLQSFCSRYITA